MKGESPKVSIQLTVADLGITEAFYAGILQLPVQRAFTMRGSPEHLVMKAGGMGADFRRGNVGCPAPSVA